MVAGTLKGLTYRCLATLHLILEHLMRTQGYEIYATLEDMVCQVL
jgi:hypothetical protein